MRTLTKWSVADYQQMRALGLLDRRRCELIEGEIWDMAPEGELHRFVNHRGVKSLRGVLKERAEVFEAHPITLANSEPEPDLAIVRPPDTRYLQRHPTPQDIYWLVEVADSTLNYDLTTKRQLYARAGIPEYWVVDVAGRRLQVFRDPQQGDFQSQKTLTSGVVSPLAFPDLTIEVAAVVGLP